VAFTYRVRNICRGLVGAVLLCLALTVSAAVPPTRVLVIHSFGPEFGDVDAEPLRGGLDRRLSAGVEVYETWLIPARLDDSETEADYLKYLRSLFVNRPVDLIVTFGAPAANFLQAHRQALFPSVPALFTHIEERRIPPTDSAANDAAVAISVNFPQVVDNILRLRPATANLAIVIGNSPIERYWGEEIQRSLAAYAGRVKLIWLKEMAWDDLLQRVARLPPDAAILYAVLSSEIPGIPTGEYRALERLHAAANAPLFSYTDAYLGKGIVGGPLISTEEENSKIVDMAVRLLGGEPASALKTAPLQLANSRFDVRELRRWGISEAALPPDSAILFSTPTVWSRYGWLILSAASVFLLQTALIVALLYERRRRKAAEIEAHRRIAELAHMNRRATVGELSAAIAHELNQPLGAILRNSEAAEVILERADPDIQELKEIVGDIKHDDQRAGKVIQRLRQLLAKAPLESQEIDLNTLLGEVFEFIAAQAAARQITLATRLTDQVLRINGDRIQLQQVILNLVVNAMDALGVENGGERLVIGRTDVLDGGSARVSIEDSGPGIPPEKAKQLFEPFFTSKANGMGMGLSIARTIIDSHGGRVWGENLEGGGAVFRFVVPLSRTRASGRGQPEAVQADAGGHSSVQQTGIAPAARAGGAPVAEEAGGCIDTGPFGESACSIDTGLPGGENLRGGPRSPAAHVPSAISMPPAASSGHRASDIRGPTPAGCHS
jgi:signal transduction histidine kinase